METDSYWKRLPEDHAFEGGPSSKSFQSNCDHLLVEGTASLTD
jgi:hypothetical protein